MVMSQIKNISKISIAFILFVVFALLSLSVILFEVGDTQRFFEVRVGEPAPRDFFAPISFELINEKATEKLRRSALDKVPLIYAMDAIPLQEAEKRLDDIFKAAAEDIESPADAKILVLIEEEGWQEDFKTFRGSLLTILKIPSVSKESKELLKKEPRDIVFIDREGIETKIIPEDVLTEREVKKQLIKQLQKSIQNKKRYQLVFLPLVEELVRPTFLLSAELNQKRENKLLGDVSAVMDSVQKNEILIEKGKIVSAEGFQKYQAATEKLRNREAFSHAVGNGLLVLLTYGIFASYFFLFEKKTFLDLKGLFLMHTAIFVTLLLERFAFLLPPHVIYLTLPASLATLLVSTLTRSRAALTTALVIILLTAILSSFQPDIILFAAVGSFTGIYAASGIRKRSQFLKVGLLIGCANLIALTGYWLLQNVQWRESLYFGGLGFGNGFLVMLLFFFLVFLFERFFKITTDITLLELSDLNHPLLKRMVLEAPGTYHHTLMIANLCESAARAIGANPLLARVGSYFHDIGKMERAEYYTENTSVAQIEAEGRVISPHERITPEASRDIIMAHVKDGIELGKKNKLPKVILNFIPEHQGTCVIYYFYKKALEQEKQGGPAVNADDYRYSGPKPQSKETAIALLADSVEASSRSLKDHSKESLKQNLKKVINEKFIDGQLEECDLTLKDLEAIAESFVRVLIGVHHTRVQYPEREQKEGAPKPFAD